MTATRFGQTAAIPILAIVAALIAVADGPALVRVPAGLTAVLVLPGLALASLVLAPGTVDRVERVAFALAGSIALVVVVAPILARSPLALSPEGFILATTLTTVILWSLALVVQRLRGRPAEPEPVDVDGVVKTLAQVSRPAVGIAALGIVLTAGVLVAGISLPATATTSFYVRDLEGLPGTLATPGPGGPELRLPVGIQSHEPGTTRFTLRADSVTGRQLGASGPVDVDAGATWEGEIALSPSTADVGRDVLIQLFREGDAEPFRTLRIWLDGAELRAADS